jgi:SAM-dependent methyltransferase
VCPACRAHFAVHVESADDVGVVEGKLVCSGCRVSFPITGGIPCFLPPELSPAKKATADAFGYEWTHYSKLTDADRAEFLDWIKPLSPDSFAGRVVLDAGCGKGRHIVLAAKFEAREVVGIDLSDAVKAAYQNTRHLPNVHVVQADIFQLPFADPFDLVYSIGVLHHLPDPKKGFLTLTKHVKPGGRISIWVYGKEGNLWIERFVDPLRIHITSRLPKLAARCLSLLMALPLYAALKLVYGPVQRRPGLVWLKARLPYVEYLCAISGYSFGENFWNVFDHLVAPTAFYHSREEVQDWFAEARINQIEITQRNNNSWRGTGLISNSWTA